MKILLYDMGAYTQNDLIYFLKKMGITCKNIYYSFPDIYEDEFFCRRFDRYLAAERYDCVMSINYFPLVAGLCYKHDIKYLSWSYDSPLSYKKLRTFHYPTNYIFLFDRLEYESVRNQGYDTVYHMPLGINIDRLAAVSLSHTEKQQYGCDISMVGQIYRSDLPVITAPLPDYDKGYIDSIVQAQLVLYGYYLVNDRITEELLDKIRNAHMAAGQELEINRPELSIAIATQITRLERLNLLRRLCSRHQTVLYSRQVPELPPQLSYRGTASYFDVMPKVFKASRININATLKCICSGIPLRALDILGSGGLLFSNYQAELTEYFEPGNDVVIYESMEDAIEKAGYYLEHEEERQRIAANGLSKTAEIFPFQKQLGKIFQIAGLS